MKTCKLFASYLQEKPLKNEENIAICKLFASYLQQKPSKSINLAAAMHFFANILDFFLQSQQNHKNAIFAGRFAKELQKKQKIALQQLILYFLMVFVANSLQIAIFSSFFNGFCCK